MMPLNVLDSLKLNGGFSFIIEQDNTGI